MSHSRGYICPPSKPSCAVTNIEKETHQVLKLPPRLLHNAVLSTEDDAHPREVANLGATHDERVNVEPAASQDARNAGEHSGLVLDETVEHVPVYAAQLSSVPMLRRENERKDTYFLNGCKLGGGVLYKMFVTASSAVRDRGRSIAGSGGGRCRRVRL